MTASPNLLNDTSADLQHFEGFEAFVYDDATGHRIVPGYTLKGFPTIGYGLNLGAGLTQAESAYLLAGRILDLIAYAARDLAPFWDNLCEARQRVVINMLYEVGEEGFDEFQKFRTALIQGKYDIAAAEMLNSKAAEQAPSRWQWLANTMSSGVAVAPWIK